MQKFSLASSAQPVTGLSSHFKTEQHLFHAQSNTFMMFYVASQIEKGKLHGCIDVGLSVMAVKKKAKCIDLDAEENIYHLKVNHIANEQMGICHKP